MNNTDLFIMAPVSRWDILASEHVVLKDDVLEAGKMGKHKNLNAFDKDQTEMAR